HAGQRRDQEAEGDAALGALLGLGAPDREAVTTVDDVHTVDLGAGDHRLLRGHRPDLLDAGHLFVATHWLFAPTHRMAIMRPPTPTTHSTIASDTGPMRSMPLPPGSFEALIVST